MNNMSHGYKGNNAFQPYEECRVKVTTFDMADPANPVQIAETVIDHNNGDHRVWLGKHTWWAFRNAHGIQTAPTTDAVTWCAPRRTARPGRRQREAARVDWHERDDIRDRD